MQLRKFNGFFVCDLQIEVHTLFLNALSFEAHTVVKHYLIFQLGDSRSLNGC